MRNRSRSKYRIVTSLWFVLLCLFITRSPAFARDTGKPQLLTIDTNFGFITTGISKRIDGDTPRMIHLLGLDTAPPPTTVELYRKAALLEYLRQEKAYLLQPQGEDQNRLAFQKLLDFLKAHRPSAVPDDAPDLVAFLQQIGTTVPEMQSEFQKILEIIIDADGTVHCNLNGLFPRPVPIHRDHIEVIPFSDMAGDLPASGTEWVQGQVMKILKDSQGGGTLDENEANFADLTDMREQLKTASDLEPFHLVRLEYQYQTASSTLTIRAGTKHTVSNVLIFDYAASDSSGAKRKQDLEQLLRAQLNHRELRREQVNEVVRRVVATYLGSHDHPQPNITVHYEEDGDDLFGLIGLDIDEGKSFRKPIALTGTLENNVPSGRLTGRASLANQNLLGRGIVLQAAGSIGGEEGANLAINAPAGIFRDRAWQIDGGFAKLEQIRLSSGTFVEQRRFLEFQFPLSNQHPAAGAPFYAKYFPTGYRYRIGQYDLTPDGGTRQRYTVGMVGFRWRGDSKDYWEKTPIPRNLLTEDARTPFLVRQSPFQLDVDVGAKLLGGDAYFVRGGFEARTHVVLATRWLLALRGSVGLASDSTPILEQPALGGDSTPSLLRAFNPEYFRGLQVGSGTVEIRYFTTDSLALTVGGDFGIAKGGAAPAQGIQDSLAIGVYWLNVPQIGGNLGLFWATGAGNSRWSLALTGGF